LLFVIAAGPRRKVSDARYSKALSRLSCRCNYLRVMSINLKTAKGHGLDVPVLLQRRADEVFD
jgi:hypothetical protein